MESGVVSTGEGVRALLVASRLHLPPRIVRAECDVCAHVVFLVV